MIRYFVMLLTVLSLCASPSFAADTKDEVRPSHLLNVETSSTLSQRNFVASLFGSSMRAAYGLLPGLETRVDFAWNTLIDVETSYSLVGTVKYGVWSSPMFGVAVLGQAGLVRSITTTVGGFGASTDGVFAGKLALSAKVASVLVTAVPFISYTTVTNSDPTYGSDFAVAVPVVSWADAIGELGFVAQSNTDTYARYAAGVAFKPANRITIPVVVANRQSPTQKTIGLAAIFAHIGFEL